jgi:DNA-binding NtrC family response regulator
VLVVDDDRAVCQALELTLTYHGYEVWVAHDGEAALARLERERAAGREPSAILTDVKMPKLDGIALVERLQEHRLRPAVVVISGHGDIPTAVEAVKKGAADFLEKPIEENRLLLALSNAIKARALELENAGLTRQVGALKKQALETWQWVGSSPSARSLREQIARVAAADVSVLITGENGTGKEVVARQIHLQSARATGPFVTVNCAAIPAELVESELFGHERGSFTGASDRRVGHFEAAQGGTLFLDEVGDMPLAAQAKVLRALETREITRVGASRSFAVDIRVLAATNADLQQAVEQKSFRQDLYYRLRVVPLAVPPLREHMQDLPDLAEHFLAQIGRRWGRVPPLLDPQALERLARESWPGNVRQLRNVLEAACVFAPGERIEAEHVETVLGAGSASFRPAADSTAPASPARDPAQAVPGDDPFQARTFEEFKDRSEAEFIRRRLAQYGGNVKRTAEELGMQRSHLYKKLDRYGLK